MKLKKKKLWVRTLFTVFLLFPLLALDIPTPDPDCRDLSFVIIYIQDGQNNLQCWKGDDLVDGYKTLRFSIEALRDHYGLSSEWHVVAYTAKAGPVTKTFFPGELISSLPSGIPKLDEMDGAVAISKGILQVIANPECETLPFVERSFTAKVLHEGIVLSWETDYQHLPDWQQFKLYQMVEDGAVLHATVEQKTDQQYEQLVKGLEPGRYVFRVDELVMGKDGQPVVIASQNVKVDYLSDRLVETKIFPNRVDHITTIQTEVPAKLRLFTITGVPVMDVWISTYHQQVDLSNLLPGQYIAWVEHESREPQVLRLVKK